VRSPSRNAMNAIAPRRDDDHDRLATTIVSRGGSYRESVNSISRKGHDQAIRTSSPGSTVARS